MPLTFDNSGRPKRRQRITRKLLATSSRPRMAVFRSNRHIYVQVIEDRRGVTVAAASSLEKTVTGSNKSEIAGVVGTLVAERSLKAGVSDVVFDRRGFAYHGRIKRLAEAAREKGMNF